MPIPKHGKRDKNESAIVAVFNRLNGFFEKTNDGHDGFLHLFGKTYAVEIKDGNKSLTIREVNYMNAVREFGIRVYILRNEMDAYALCHGHVELIANEKWELVDGKARRIDV